MLALCTASSSLVRPAVLAPAAIVPRAAIVAMGLARDTAERSYLWRLEWSVTELANQLGVPAPARLGSYNDEIWTGVLEEVLPYLERQWSTSAQVKAFDMDMLPDDALSLSDRSSLRSRYVQRLEQQVSFLSNRDVISMVHPARSFSTRAEDDTYVAELEEAAEMLAGKFTTSPNAAW